MVRHRKFDPPFVRKPFSVRVVVPSYKEDIETLEETVECAIKAAKIAIDKGQANAGTSYRSASSCLYTTAPVSLQETTCAVGSMCVCMCPFQGGPCLTGGGPA